MGNDKPMARTLPLINEVVPQGGAGPIMIAASTPPKNCWP